jgi:ankyrin repeat protein
MGIARSKDLFILELVEYSGFLSLYDLCKLYNLNNIPLKMIHYVKQTPNCLLHFFEIEEDYMLPLLTMVINNYSFNNINDNSPLLIAAEKGYSKALELILSLPNLNCNITENKNNWTPLILACRYNHPMCVSILTQILDIDINKCSNFGISPLQIACSTGNEECVKILLNFNHIDVNSADKQGLTPLFSASWCGHTNCVRRLLKMKGINIKKTKFDGTTPFMAAIQNNRHEIIKLFYDFKTGI